MRATPRVAGFRSEYPAGFDLECMAGFVGIRTWAAVVKRAWIRGGARIIAVLKDDKAGGDDG
jgi:hypothetical protein